MEKSRFKLWIAGWLIVALGLAAVTAGCGGESTDGAGGSTSREEFILKANEICEEHNVFLRQAMIEAFDPEKRPGDEAGIRFTKDVWVPDMRAQDEELRAIDWPTEDRTEISEMLDEILRAADRVEADPELASRGPFDPVTRALTDYGIGACGSP